MREERRLSARAARRIRRSRRLDAARRGGTCSAPAGEHLEQRRATRSSVGRFVERDADACRRRTCAGSCGALRPPPTSLAPCAVPTPRTRERVEERARCRRRSRAGADRSRSAAVSACTRRAIAQDARRRRDRRRTSTPSPRAAPARCRCCSSPCRGGCAARASAAPGGSAGRPSASCETPTMRPGICRLCSSVVARNAACGPPKPIGTPKRCDEPTAMSAPISPGERSSASASRSVATTASAPRGVQRRDDAGEVGDAAVGRRIRQQRTGERRRQRQRRASGRPRALSTPMRLGARADDRDRLRMAVFGDEERAPLSVRDGEAHGHRLGRGGGFVEQRRVRERQAR